VSAFYGTGNFIRSRNFIPFSITLISNTPLLFQLIQSEPKKTIVLISSIGNGMTLDFAPLTILIDYSPGESAVSDEKKWGIAVNHCSVAGSLLSYFSGDISIPDETFCKRFAQTRSDRGKRAQPSIP
jgi:hypothetical protein